MPGARIASGERVTLRTVEDDDREFLARAGANPELRYPMGNPSPRSLAAMSGPDPDDDSDRFLVCLDGPDAGPGGVEEGETERIGWAAVEDADWRRPQLSYWLAPEYQGEGYGREAIGLVVEFAFRAYDRPAVAAQVYDHNAASRGVLESLGFEQEGRLRKERFIDGEYRDTLWYGLLREDWDGPG